MLEASEYKHTAREYRTNREEAGYISKSQPLCFAFIDPLPKDIGDNPGDIAEWYREQVAMFDKVGAVTYKPENFARDASRELYADGIIEEADKVLASSIR